MDGNEKQTVIGCDGSFFAKSYTYTTGALAYLSSTISYNGIYYFSVSFIKLMPLSKICSKAFCFLKGSEIMKELKLPSEKKRRIKAKKPFYAFLALCLVAVCVAGYTAIEKSLSYTKPIEEPFVHNQSEKVDKPAENIVDSSTEEESTNEEKPVNTNPEPQSEPTLLIWPVNGGELAKEYSADALVFSETMQDWRTHNGIDIFAPVGTAVRAMAAGEVKDIRNDEMLGWVMDIAHGSYTASYCNLQEGMTVKVGDKVEIGAQIGGVSDQARLEMAEKPHLHLEVRKNGELIDPMSVMNNTDLE